jgi:uncharacterized protein (TIGR03067 family)
MIRKLLSAAAVALCAAALSVAAHEPADKDLKALQGAWRQASAELDGKPFPAEEVKRGTWTFKGDEVLFAQGGTVFETSKVKLDASKSPRHIDLVPQDGPDKGKTVAGIYELKDGKLTVCLPDRKADAKARPAEFKSGKTHALIVFERDKGEKKDEKKK